MRSSQRRSLSRQQDLGGTLGEAIRSAGPGPPFSRHGRAAVCGNGVKHDEADHDDDKGQDVESGELRTRSGSEFRAAIERPPPPP